MKLNRILTSTLAVAALLVLITTLSNCSKDNPQPQKTEAEKVTEMLVSNGGKWSPSGASSITVDGLDVTADLFPGFSITFSENTFTTTGTSPVWLRQDTWSFKDETAKVIIRGQDGKEITITDISATAVKLRLTWDKTTYEGDGGRGKSLAGTYEFVLTK